MKTEPHAEFPPFRAKLAAMGRRELVMHSIAYNIIRPS